MRLVLKAKASLFKCGVHVPKNDREVKLPPERRIWKAARTLEWLRLLKVGAFEGQWTKASIAENFPHVHPKDIGHVFFVYDYKHSGEAKARLVFDGSRQSPDTHDETFAPTARPESVRRVRLSRTFSFSHFETKGPNPCDFVPTIRIVLPTFVPFVLQAHPKPGGL
jgi:hypothetical protein